MTHITLNQLEPELTERLQQRASQNGRTVEAEITAILASVLIPEPPSSQNLDLATALEQRFSVLEDFELPETSREPMRTPPTF